MPAPGPKIQIQWNDLKTRKVDQRLREHEALARNRRQAEMNPLDVRSEGPVRSGSIWYNAVFTMAMFGLLGGLMAWGGGEAARLRPNPRIEADSHLREIAALVRSVGAGEMLASDAEGAIAVLQSAYSGNPYFAIYNDTSSSTEAKEEQLRELDRRESWKTFIANALGFGVSGMLIALCLSIAEPIVDRNWRGALLSGSIGAAAGLLGGVIVSLFVDRLYTELTRAAGEIAAAESYRSMIAHAISWGVLGLFLSIAPGLVMRNARKLFIGMAGGLLGGLVGGALFEPIGAAAGGNAHLSRLVALLAIGVVAGAATGLIENAAKSGWLKVTAGLIAGKQFILYRNPTFIGSGPECQIYLFRDAKVGRRHAAIHLVPGGFELENLPMGATTLVNGREIQRTRLRNGDKVQVGATIFAFAEKEKS